MRAVIRTTMTLAVALVLASCQLLIPMETDESPSDPAEALPTPTMSAPGTDDGQSPAPELPTASPVTERGPGQTPEIPPPID